MNVSDIKLAVINNPIFVTGLSALIVFLMTWLQQKIKNVYFQALLNPIIWGTLGIIFLYKITRTDLHLYHNHASFLNFCLPLAMILFSVDVFKNWSLVRGNLGIAFLGCLFGTLLGFTSATIILMYFEVFPQHLHLAFLMKSLNSAFAIGLTQSINHDQIKNLEFVSVLMSMLTGLFSNIFLPMIIQLFRLKKYPIAWGVATGMVSHTLGSARAREIDSLAGAFAILSMGFTGIISMFVIHWFLIFL